MRTKTPAPSPTIRPSAFASNGEHRPDCDSARNWQKPICVYWLSAPFAPPASITSARPESSSSQASLIAYSDEAHAASRVYVPPPRPSDFANSPAGSPAT